MKFHVDETNKEQTKRKSEKELKQAESQIAQMALGQLNELKDVLKKTTRS